MSGTTLDGARTLDDARLAELGLKHLEREETLLEATLSALQRIRVALLAGDLEVLAETQRQHEELVRAGNVLRQERARFRQEAAQLLGGTSSAGESVTLQTLAARLPGEAGEQLAQGRERLRRLAREVEHLNGSNVSLIYYCLDFLDRFFMEITGREPSGGRYGPSGTHQEAACGSILEARG